MSELDIRNKIKDSIAKVSDIEIEDISDNASFKEDLGLDSLALLEIAVDIGLQFSLDLPEDALGRLRTVQDAVELVQQSLVYQP